MSNVGKPPRWRTPVVAATAVYLLVLALLVLGPWGWGLNRITVRLYTQFLYTWPIAPHWALPEHYGLILNVLLFVPLGAALVLLTDWAWWRVSVFAAVASGAIEITQWLWLAREAQVVDVVANTAGAALGAWVVTALGGVRRRATARSGRGRRR